jgi:hypothetical protein
VDSREEEHHVACDVVEEVVAFLVGMHREAEEAFPCIQVEEAEAFPFLNLNKEY